MGVVDMVYAGKHDTTAPGPEEYGVRSAATAFMAWITG